MIFTNQGQRLISILCKQLLKIAVCHSMGFSEGVSYVLGGAIIGILRPFSVVCKLILFSSRWGIADNTYSWNIISITKDSLGDILIIHIRALRTYPARLVPGGTLISSYKG